MMAINKTVSFGFAASWKAAANYMKEAANVITTLYLRHVLMLF
jgi:hypothetical protein